MKKRFYTLLYAFVQFHFFPKNVKGIHLKYNDQQCLIKKFKIKYVLINNNKSVRMEGMRRFYQVYFFIQTV